MISLPIGPSADRESPKACWPSERRDGGRLIENGYVRGEMTNAVERYAYGKTMFRSAAAGAP
jgi:hypothetical protein